MRTIVVTGDLIRDFYLVRNPRPAAHHHETVPHTLLQERDGGAWYLRDLISLACSDLEARILAPDPRSPTWKAYTIWSPHARSEGEKAQVWRVEQFLGCEPVTDFGAPPDASEAPGAAPDLLVIDDLGLDFRHRPELWPALLRGEAGPPRSILLKCSVPVAEGALWDTLLDRFADRLTVLLSANALRARPAVIQDSISWDLAIEETAREIEQGASALDLGRCRRVLVQFGAAGAASFDRGNGDRAAFERFLYHPEELEGSWSLKHPGATFGAQSLLTAALARHVCEPGSYPLFVALGRGLAAVRRCHEIGGGASRFDTDAAHEAIRSAFHPGRGPDGKLKEEPAAAYHTAFPHGLLAQQELRRQPAQHSDLVRDLTGLGLEYLAAKATEVVLRGPRDALAAAPKAKYGYYLTVDRQEIEQINTIRAVILAYLRNREDRKPLSLAVFGQPGSGKSFAIKQLAAEIFPGQKSLTFNLAAGGFDSEADLHAAFHQVRDASLLGQVPLVFWDEFDKGELRWLGAFLAPMQDAEFQQGSRVHHLGKAIFVFAGGTCWEFESFDRTEHPDPVVRDWFRTLKGPDFVGRLRGHLNIKGPNPATPEDQAYLIRRAVLLRELLNRHFPQLIDPTTQRAAVSTSVIRGFLRVEKYLHGARSMEMVLSSSRPGARFEPSALPGSQMLSGHVSPDFAEQVALGELEVPIIEALAEACHSGWYQVRQADGWSFGDPRDDANRKHPLMRRYQELSESQRESNRLTARLTNAKLLEVGYRIARFAPEDQRNLAEFSFAPEERERLMQIEHDIWLRDHLLRGYQWAPETREDLRLHRDVVAFEDQPAEDRRLDEAIVDAIPVTLRKRQYKLVKLDPSDAR